MSTPIQNEYYINGVQILTQVNGEGTVMSTSLDSLGYTTDAVSTTWADTHSTIFNARSLKLNLNPQILAVEKALLLVNDNTTPTASIGIEADITGDSGTYFGMNLFNNNDTDFGITSTFPYEGSVVFKQEGVGSDPTTTSIKQGTITLNDPDLTTVTTVSPSFVSFTDGANTTTLNQAGISTTSDLTLDIGNDFVLNGTITETSAGGYAGEYLKITINGTVYKLQLLMN